MGKFRRWSLLEKCLSSNRDIVSEEQNMSDYTKIVRSLVDYGYLDESDVDVAADLLSEIEVMRPMRRRASGF